MDLNKGKKGKELSAEDKKQQEELQNVVLQEPRPGASSTAGLHQLRQANNSFKQQLDIGIKTLSSSVKDLEKIMGQIKKKQADAKQIKTLFDELSRIFNNGLMQKKKKNNEIRDFFFNNFNADFMEKLVTVAPSKSRAIEEQCEEIVQVLRECLNLLGGELETGNYDEKFLSAMTWCFDPNTDLHKHYFNLTLEKMQEQFTRGQAWRKDLVAASSEQKDRVLTYIDVRIPVMSKTGVGYEQPLTKEQKRKAATQAQRTQQVEPVKQSTAEDWIRGRIKRVLSEEEARLNVVKDYSGDQVNAPERNVLHVVFPELPERYDMFIDRWSTNIAKCGTFTHEEYAWKDWLYQQPRKLPVQVYGKNEIEYHDMAFVVQVFMENKWWDATIVDFVEENRTDKHGSRPFMLAKIGYRVYCDSAFSIKRDSQQRYFIGFGESRDEYIPLYSPRICGIPDERYKHYEDMVVKKLENLEKEIKDVELKMRDPSKRDEGEDQNYLDQLKASLESQQIAIEKGLPFQERIKSSNFQKNMNEAEMVERERDQNFATESEQLLLDNIVKFRSSDTTRGGLKVEKYCLPRPGWCVSQRFVEIMNSFATKGGFHQIIRALRTPPNSSLPIQSAHHLSLMISLVHQLFHQDLSMWEGRNFATFIRKHLLESKDLNKLKDYEINNMLQSVIAIEYLVQIDEQETEARKLDLKLQVFLKCIEMTDVKVTRIYGLKQLVALVKESERAMRKLKGEAQAQAVEHFENLLDQIIERKFFEKMWTEPEEEIIQSSGEIFKILLKHNQDKRQFDKSAEGVHKNKQIEKRNQDRKEAIKQITEDFWRLTNVSNDVSNVKQQVYKVLAKCTQIDLSQMKYICQQIEDSMPQGVDKLQFEMIQENICFHQERTLRPQIISIFWKVISNSEKYKDKEGLVDHAIEKFIKFNRKQFLMSDVEELSLSLYEKLKDKHHKSTVSLITLMRRVYSQTTSKAVRAASDDGTDPAVELKKKLEDIHNAKREADGITYPKVEADDQASKERKDMIAVVIDNFKQYIEVEVKKAVEDKKLPDKDSVESPIKMEGAQHTHNKEIETRLNFIAQVAKLTKRQFDKELLDDVYEIIANSKVTTDMNIFFSWCSKNLEVKKSSDFQPLTDKTNTEFFKQKIQEDEASMRLDQLPMEGFQFLVNMFKSENEKTRGNKSLANNITDSDEIDERKAQKVLRLRGTLPEDPTFFVTCEPSQLEQIEVMWKVALLVQEPEVKRSATAFLVNLYLSVYTKSTKGKKMTNPTVQEQMKELEDAKQYYTKMIYDRKKNAEAFIKEVFDRIEQYKAEQNKVERLIYILKTMIKVTELNGVNVQPHYALDQGEMIRAITVKLQTADFADFSKKRIDQTIVVDIASTATVWELKEQVAKKLGLGGKYIKLTLPDEKTLYADSHGKLLSQIYYNDGTVDKKQLDSGITLIAEKIPFAEKIHEAPLAKDEKSKILTEDLENVLREIFDRFKSEETDALNRAQAAAYLTRVLRQRQVENNSQVDEFMKHANSSQLITFTGFKSYYREKVVNKNTVQKHLRSLFYRKDLIKLSEPQAAIVGPAYVVFRDQLDENGEEKKIKIKIKKASTQDEEPKNEDGEENKEEDKYEEMPLPEGIGPMFPQKEMPRYIISNRDEYNKKLWELLKGQGSRALKEEVWDLVCQLATNKGKYEDIIKQAPDINAIKQAGDNYESRYYRQIIFDIMNNNDPTRSQDISLIDSDRKEARSIDTERTPTERVSQNIKLNDKQEWVQKFLNADGFKQVYERVVEANQQKLEMTELAFLLPLIQNNIERAFQENKLDEGKSKKLYLKAWELLQGVILNTDQQYAGQAKSKVVAENSLAIMVSTMRKYQSLYANEFKTKAMGKKILIKGLLAPEIRVRVAFRDQIQILTGSDQSKIEQLFDNIITDFFEEGKDNLNQDNVQWAGRTHTFFELCQMLIEKTERSSKIYQKTKDRIEKIMDQIGNIQKIKAGMTAKDDPIEALQEEEKADWLEVMLEDLIKLSSSLIRNSDNRQDIVRGTDLNLIEFFFQKFLFASHYQQDSDNQAKDDSASTVVDQKPNRSGDKQKSTAATSKSHKAAYDLLIELFKDNESKLKEVIGWLYDLSKQMEQPKTWGVKPVVRSVRYQKYLGLQNLGMTCYMNSVLQQIFMIPSLRFNLLCTEQENISRTILHPRTQERFVDTMRTQLQIMIANLELSERTEYSMNNFCYAYKQRNEDNNNALEPTNTGMQKDSSEFMLDFFDKLSESLKDTSRRFIIEDTFGYKMCSQLTCNNCQRTKNRIEPQMTLDVQVKGMKSIEESIANQIKGEQVDLKCESCGQTNKKFLKRENFANMPNMFIIKLNRLSYDIQSGENRKVNSRCEFPPLLDMKKYYYHTIMDENAKATFNAQKASDQSRLDELKEKNKNSDNVGGVQLTKNEENEIKKLNEDIERMVEPERDENEDFVYKLVGINVHQGKANSGHYWSYINTKRATFNDDKVDPMTTDRDPWMEFNDTQVTNWDYNKFVEPRCFGTAKSAFSDFEQEGTSAYMLFYERRTKKDIRIVVDDVKDKDGSDLFNKMRNDAEKGIRKIAEEEELANQIEEDTEEDKRQQQQQQQEKNTDATVQIDTTNSKEPVLTLEEKKKQREERLQERVNVRVEKTLRDKFNYEDYEDDKTRKKLKVMKIPFQKSITANENDKVSDHFFKTNQYYKDVADENKKTAFKADVYSSEFLNFLPQLLEQVQMNIQDDKVLNQALQVGRKVGFEIMARLPTLRSIENLSKEMVNIMDKLSKNPSGVAKLKDFMQSMIKSQGDQGQAKEEQKAFEGLLFECKDKIAQRSLSKVVMYALCFFRDNDEAVAKEFLKDVEQVYFKQFTEDNSDENDERRQRQQNLPVLFSILLAMITKQPDKINKEESQDDPKAVKAGARLFWKENMFSHYASIMLQDKMPEDEDTSTSIKQFRWLGSSLRTRQIERVLHLMIHDMVTSLRDGKPVRLPNDVEFECMQRKQILKRMIDQKDDYLYVQRSFDYNISTENLSKLRKANEEAARKQEKDVELSDVDFTEALIIFATEDERDPDISRARKVSKAMAKQYIERLYRIINNLDSIATTTDAQAKALHESTARVELKQVLASIQKYLQINDKLTESRLEWILGFPMIAARKSKNSERIVWGTGKALSATAIKSLTDHYYNFKSAVCYKQDENCLLGYLAEMRIRKCAFYFEVADAIIDSCRNVHHVAEYVARMPSPVLTSEHFVGFLEQAGTDEKIKWTIGRVQGSIADEDLVSTLRPKVVAFKQVTAIKSKLAEIASKIQSLQGKTKGQIGWASKDKIKAVESAQEAGQQQTGAAPAQNQPANLAQNLPGGARGRQDNNEPNDLEYLNNYWPGKAKEGNIKLTELPYNQAKFTYPPQYIVASRIDDEKDPKSSPHGESDLTRIAECAIASSTGDKNKKTMQFTISMLKCRPNTIWSLPDGKLNLAMPLTPREHDYVSEASDNSQVVFDASTLKTYIASKSVKEEEKSKWEEEKKKWDPLGEADYDKDHFVAHLKENKGYGYQKTQKRSQSDFFYGGAMMGNMFHMNGGHRHHQQPASNAAPRQDKNQSRRQLDQTEAYEDGSVALFMIKSNDEGQAKYKVKFTLTCTSDNVLMPKSEFYVATKDGTVNQVFFIAQKINPAGEWGNFSVQFNSAKEVKKQEENQMNQSYLLHYMSELHIREKEDAEREEMEGMMGPGGRHRHGGGGRGGGLGGIF